MKTVKEIIDVLSTMNPDARIQCNVAVRVTIEDEDETTLHKLFTELDIVQHHPTIVTLILE